MNEREMKSTGWEFFDWMEPPDWRLGRKHHYFHVIPPTGDDKIVVAQVYIRGVPAFHTETFATVEDAKKWCEEQTASDVVLKRTEFCHEKFAQATNMLNATQRALFQLFCIQTEINVHSEDGAEGQVSQ